MCLSIRTNKLRIVVLAIVMFPVIGKFFCRHTNVYVHEHNSLTIAHILYLGGNRLLFGFCVAHELCSYHSRTQIRREYLDKYCRLVILQGVSGACNEKLEEES